MFTRNLSGLIGFHSFLFYGFVIKTRQNPIHRFLDLSLVRGDLTESAHAAQQMGCDRGAIPMVYKLTQLKMRTA
jgi:hypothetical protein